MSIVRPSIPINQSTKIFFGLFIGYLVYITIKGELPAYAALLVGTAPTTNQTDATASGGAGFNPAVTDARVSGTPIDPTLLNNNNTVEIYSGGTGSNCPTGSFSPTITRGTGNTFNVSCGACGIYNGITKMCDPL